MSSSEVGFKRNRAHSENFTDPTYFVNHPWAEYAFVVSAFLSQVFTQASTNTPLVQLNAISKHYDASSLERTWFQASFSLSAGALILVSGRIGDVYGLRLTALWGYLWSIVWTFLIGVSFWTRNIEFYIVGRALQGAGIAFVLPNLMGIVGRVYQPGTHRKNMVFALIGMGAPLGGISGVLFSGLITEETPAFYWAYFSTGISMCFALGLTWWSAPKVSALADSAADVDWIGCGLSVSGLVLLNFVLNQAPIVGWDTPYVIALIVISVVVLAVFIWYELHIPKTPLIPPAVLKAPRLLTVLLMKSLGWGSFGILFFHYFTFLMDFRHYNPLEAGASITHCYLFGSVAAVACGYAIRHIPIHFILIFSMVCFTGASVMQAVTPVDQTYWALTFPTWIVSVLSTDSSFPSGSIILSEHLPPEYQGMAGSLINTVVNYSNSLFLGLSTTVETQYQKMYPDNPLIAFRAAMYFAIGLAAAGLLLSIAFTGLEMWEGKVFRPHPAARTSSDDYIGQDNDAAEKEFTPDITEKQATVSLGER